MNIFEDLVVELKEQNLLESTIIDDGHSLDRTGFEEAVDFDSFPNTEDSQSNGFADDVDGPQDASDLVPEDLTPKSEAGGGPDAALVSTVDQERESYKKRAVAEVSGLQMVEHVLTGVEREYMKIVPKTFDDLNAKKALHAFLNVNDSIGTGEHATSEFTLLQETEAWCTALCERDREIPVSSVRLYCENSRPALSSQALVGMARFYRNLPYSETVRAKFDFIITRLFSRPKDDETRVCLFTRDEMLIHVNTLYKEWSCIPLYTAEEDESKVLLTALSFEDLAIEAEQASTFDQLIRSDFFSRLRLF
ncbi:MAG: hypothetical protein ABIV21_08970, partial [Pyrinomonadaceae bacterium]